MMARGIVSEPNVDERGAKKKNLNRSQCEGATDRLMEQVVGFGRIQILTQNENIFSLCFCRA